MSKDKELDLVLGKANIFWGKFGKFTKFKTKDEYIKYVKQYHKWYKSLPKEQQQEYVKNTQDKIKFALDGIEKLKNDKKAGIK